MANQIKPKWYEPRKCFRSRKTINGKVKAFYGGLGGSGSNDQQAYARAVIEIGKNVDIAEAAEAEREALAALGRECIEDRDAIYEAYKYFEDIFPTEYLTTDEESLLTEYALLAKSDLDLLSEDDLNNINSLRYKLPKGASAPVSLNHRVPFMQKMRAMEEQIEQLQEENALLAARLAAKDQ